jgi:transmembrane sensor
MTTGEFDRLVQRYRTGECTSEEIAFVEQWIEANGGNTDDESTVFESETDAAGVKEEVWARIHDHAELGRKKRTWMHSKWTWSSVAAGVILAASSLFFLKTQLPKDSQAVLSGVKTINASTNHQRIFLPDSSIVTLAEGASLLTAENFGYQTRTVHLKGEAFFEVRPDAKIPFLVYSGDLVTEVLGTSFRIKPETKTIEVSVTTGKVSVYSSELDRNQRTKGVIITPNQKAVYDMELKQLRQDLVETPRMITNDLPGSSFDFDDTPVRTVLETLRNSYGMEIVVRNPDLNDCVFTGNLNGFDLFKQLDYICNIIGSRYEVRGTTIFLIGEGCSSKM